MKIDYCPKCKKAGLKYERYPSNPYLIPPLEPDEVEIKENSDHRAKHEKWCPRCQEWVRPENQPYIGARGIA
jgi:hypothetical protein